LRPRLTRSFARLGLILVLLAAGCFPLCAAFPDQTKPPASRPPASGFITFVYDGDTVRIRLADGKEEKVRLIGIDAPELDDPRDAVRFMAEVAKRAAILALSRRPVRLEYDWELRDKYGRLLAFVWVDEAALVNEFLVREGFAAVLTAFPFRKDYQERLRKAERLARAEEKGLWRREPLPVVAENEAVLETGRVASVSFICRGLRRTRSLIILEGESGRFRAIIPRRGAGVFAGLEGFPGQRIIVSGLVEERAPGCEIRLFSPYQLTALQAAEK